MKKKHKFFLIKGLIIIISLISFLSHHYLHRQYCLEDRYAFDFGSGSIKAKAVSFDKCSNRIHKVFAQYDKPVKFANCMEKKTDSFQINQECIQQAIIEFKNFEYELDINCKDKKCAGVATAWARKADNVNVIMDALKAVGVKIKVLSQSEEGFYGFYSVVKSNLDVDIQDIIVWDIGGGSFQLSTLDHNNQLHVYHGQHGIETFEDELRSVMKVSANSQLPFFIGDDLNTALEYAYEKYGKLIMKDELIAKKLLHNKNLKIYAIGGPMTKGFKRQMYIPTNMKPEHLLKSAKIFEKKSINEIKAFYYPELPLHYIPSAQISCILVHGLMKGGNMKSVEILDNTLSEYVLYDKTLW